MLWSLVDPTSVPSVTSVNADTNRPNPQVRKGIIKSNQCSPNCRRAKAFQISLGAGVSGVLDVMKIPKHCLFQYVSFSVPGPTQLIFWWIQKLIQ